MKNAFGKRHPKVEKSHSTVSSVVPHEDQVTYSWKNVNVTSFPRGRCLNLFISKRKTEEVSKRILIDVNGIAKPGELLALMGASGAGKSTLLNTLTYRTSRELQTMGDCRINGLPVYDQMMSFISAYVEQEDIFLGNLTVKEHMQFAAKVVMARGAKKKLREDRIDDLIDDLLNNPPLLFCDEPTSGLDSFMSKNVMTILKKLANQGRTIISTIHQPSSEVYYLFDKVMFLSEGKVAFHGTPTDAQSFFASVGAPCPINYNPADFFITRLATKFEDTQPGAQPQKEFLQMTVESFAKSKYSKAVLDDIEATKDTTEEKKKRLSFRMDLSKHLRYQTTWFTQFRALTVRSFRDTMKSRELVTWKFIQTIVSESVEFAWSITGRNTDTPALLVAVIMSSHQAPLESLDQLIVAFLFGILYWNQGNDQDAVMNINGAIFISAVNLCLQNCFSVIHVFVDELPVFLREHYNGMYRVDVYYISKTIVELPLQILLPLIYVSIMYYMVKFNQDAERFAWHLLILILISNIGTSFGYFIGMCTADLAFALNLATPIIIPLILFSGYMCNLETMTVYLSWLRYVSWFYYAMESLLIAQWKGNNNIECSRPGTTCPPNGTVVLGMFSYEEDNFEFDVWMLFALFIILRIGALGLLHLRVLIKN